MLAATITEELEFQAWTNPLARAAEEYKAKLGSKAETTREKYKAAMDRFLAYMRGRDLTDKAVLEYASETAKGRGAAAARLQLTVVKQFLEWASVKGYTAQNYGYDLELPKVATGHKKDALTIDQAAQVVTAIDLGTMAGKRDYAIMMLMLENGLRVKEVAAIDAGDLRGDLLFVWGKGHAEKDDYVRIGEGAKGAIATYMAARQNAEGRTLADDDAVFVSYDNRAKGCRLNVDSISRIAKTAMRAAGIDSKRLTAHSCRHTMVTEALKGGATLREVQTAARHANIATTMIYAHEIDKAGNKASSIVSAAIGAGIAARAQKQ